MLRRFGTNFMLLSMVTDAAVVWLALGLVESWRPSLLWLPFSQRIESVGYVPPLLHVAVAFLWAAVLFLYSLYDPQKVFRVGIELGMLVQGACLAGLASSGLIYLAYRDVSRWTFLVFVGTAFVALFAWRMIARLIVSVDGGMARTMRRVIIVGNGPIAEHVSALIVDHQWTGLTFAGYVNGTLSGIANGHRTLGTIENLRSIVREYGIHDVVVVPPYSDSHLDAIVASIRDLALNIRVVPTSFTLVRERVTIEDFAGVPVIDLAPSPLSDYQRAAKRVLDLVLSAVLVLVCLPVLGIVAILVVVDDAGPPIFKQVRVGERGRFFTMYKFRTMVPDADNLQQQVVRRNSDGHVVHKYRDDPRVTRLGRILRRTSLDELPQLFNVLRGDMSLVGPRPELPWLVDQYAPEQRRRLVVPQGITGWWQINGRSDKLMHLHTDDDLYYVSNYSFWLDLRILLKTVVVVLQQKGAH